MRRDDGTLLALGAAAAAVAAGELLARRGSASAAVDQVLDSGICLTDNDDDEEEVFYHAIPLRLLHLAMREGLKPSAGGASFGQSTVAWSRGKVFLSAGWLNATKWHGFIEEMLGEEVGIIEVTLPHHLLSQLQVDTVSADEGDPCSFYLTVPVPPQHLEVAVG